MKVTPIPSAAMRRVAVTLLVSHMAAGEKSSSRNSWSVSTRRVDPRRERRKFSSRKMVPKSFREMIPEGFFRV